MIRIISRKRLNITRFVFGVCVIELLLNGITTSHSQDYDLILCIIGSLSILFGNVIRSWAAGIVHKKRIIAETGPYSLWRHPLYLGSAQVAVGFGLLLNDLFCWIGIILLFLIVYPTTIKKEESDMRDLHGKRWDDYVSNVGLIIPRHLTCNRIFDNWSYKQWVINKEYNALFTSLIGWNLIQIMGMLQG
jgi:protein-S-isoprenylcysteine O-methyltransferase Ste14